MWDHPRIRGEHSVVTDVACSSMGSSPHTRGARRRRPHPDEHRGIIPAYAGSTEGPHGLVESFEDHPRIRGEHASVANRMSPVEGSSPHTRGAPVHVFDDGVCGGIIPAYAGSTEANSLDGQTMADHPRIRGEHGTR